MNPGAELLLETINLQIRLYKYDSQFYQKFLK